MTVRKLAIALLLVVTAAWAGTDECLSNGAACTLASGTTVGGSAISAGAAFGQFGGSSALSGTTPQHVLPFNAVMSPATTSACSNGSLLTYTKPASNITITAMQCDTTNSQTGGTIDWYIGKYSSCTAGTLPKNAAGSGTTSIHCQGTSGNSGSCSVTGQSEAYTTSDLLQAAAIPANPTTGGTLTWFCTFRYVAS